MKLSAATRRYRSGFSIGRSYPSLPLRVLYWPQLRVATAPGSLLAAATRRYRSGFSIGRSYASLLLRVLY